MDALRALQDRVSVAKLNGPAPTQEQRQILIQAALRAADHGNLRPWRFLFIEGNGLVSLGDLFARVALSNKVDSTAAELERFRSMPLRAPLIIVTIAVCQDHPKVPQIEQLLSAGAATQQMITTAYAMGLGAIWRTGDMAYDTQIMAELGLAKGEEIVGFVYVGTPASALPEPKEISPDAFFTSWPSN